MTNSLVHRILLTHSLADVHRLLSLSFTSYHAECCWEHKNMNISSKLCWPFWEHICWSHSELSWNRPDHSETCNMMSQLSQVCKLLSAVIPSYLDSQPAGQQDSYLMHGQETKDSSHCVQLFYTLRHCYSYWVRENKNTVFEPNMKHALIKYWPRWWSEDKTIPGFPENDKESYFSPKGL